jgi:Zn-dependent M28 family amino/carboxypeptidase
MNNRCHMDNARSPALILAAGILLLSSSACLAAEPQEVISKQRIREDVRVLASDEFEGRGPGQSAEYKTLRYLVSRFKAAGLKPGGANGAWYQEVPLRQFDRGPDVKVSLRQGDGAALTLKVGEDLTLSSHASGHVSLVDAPLVFVGYGIKVPALGWDSFGAIDLHGKVALVLANDPDFEAAPDSPAYGKFEGKAMVYAGRFGAKVAAASAAGAAAVLVIHEDAAASYPWRQVANGDRIASMEIAPADGSGSSTVISGWLQREVAIRLLRSAGLDFAQLKVAARDPKFQPLLLTGVKLSADFTVTVHEVTSQNVLARLPGRARPGETVLYGAHWDANGKGAPSSDGDDIRNGAVDNATGTAELLEVARVFARGKRPARSIVFIAYTAEEKGLLGSEYYASHPVYPLERTAAVINLDPHVMLGRARDIELVGGGRTDLEDDLAHAASAEGLRLEPEPHPEAGWYFRSDHYSFSKRGVPSLSFRIGRDLLEGGLATGTARADDYNINRYHQTKDEFDPHWTFEGSAQEASVAWRVGLSIANSSRWPAWKPGVEYAVLRAQSDGERR